MNSNGLLISNFFANVKIFFIISGFV